MKMVQIKSMKFNKISTSQKVAKKHLKLHVKRLRDREYSRLREMVPSIASKEKVSKVTVIEEAVKYIDELHKALLERLQRKGVNGEVINEENVKEFLHQMMPQEIVSNTTKSSSSNYEKQQTLPTFLLQPKLRGPSKFC